MVRSRSNPLALAVLSSLRERPMHPYQISATLKQRQKETSVRLNYGSLYSVVRSLLKQGFIEEQGVSQEGNLPQRTVYRITPEGESELVDWMRGLVRVPVKEYPAIEAGLAFLRPVLAPDEAAELLRQRLDRLSGSIETEESRLSQMEETGLPRIFGIETEFALALLRAERDFLTELLASIDDKSIGGYSLWARMHELRRQGVSHAEIAENPEAFLGKTGAMWMTLGETSA
ncbi:PadR family transcriptional regulator [Actinomadura sp. NTSP31]|uniref:PadR family transcriptional regulator n=1 Tax=Actinomadura sp. NTSP31 TaxID=1735447 RepID=UPI0035C04911